MDHSRIYSLSKGLLLAWMLINYNSNAGSASTGASQDLSFQLCRSYLYEVLAKDMYSVSNISIVPKSELQISWDVSKTDQGADLWHHTQLTIRTSEMNTSVRFPINRDRTSANYSYYYFGIHSGLRYDIVIQLVDSTYNPVSPAKETSFILRPKPPTHFSAALDYKNSTIDGYPKYIAFFYDIQHRSHYDGQRILCGTRNSNGRLDIYFTKYYAYKYSSTEAENIALGKSTSQSSIKVTKDGFLLESKHAVDGVIGLNAKTAQTLPRGVKWWMVDFGKLYEIELLLIYQDQRVCGDQYCSKGLQNVKVFARIYQVVSNPCKAIMPNVLRSFMPGSSGMIRSIKFNPSFHSRHLSICTDRQYGQPLTLLEVRVYEADRTIRMKNFINLDHQVFPPGKPINCDAYSVTEIDDVVYRSQPTALTHRLATVPLPPIDVSYTFTEQRKHLIIFYLEPNTTGLYYDIRIHFLIAGNLFMLGNKREFTYEEPLVPGKRYVLESWTSTLKSLIGRVNSHQNHTLEFIAGNVSYTTSQATEVNAGNASHTTKSANIVTLSRTTDSNTGVANINIYAAYFTSLFGNYQGNFSSSNQGNCSARETDRSSFFETGRTCGFTSTRLLKIQWLEVQHDYLSTVLYIAGASSILVSGIVITAILYRQLNKNTFEQNRLQGVQLVPSGSHVYSILLKEDATIYDVAENEDNHSYLTSPAHRIHTIDSGRKNNWKNISPVPTSLSSANRKTVSKKLPAMETFANDTAIVKEDEEYYSEIAHVGECTRN